MTFSIVTPSFAQLDWLWLCDARIRNQTLWEHDLIHGNIHFGTLRKYLADFVDSGKNLRLNDNASQEKATLARQAPEWVPVLRLLIVEVFRLRKLPYGAYRLKPFSYNFFTGCNITYRVTHSVSSPAQK